MRDIDKKGIDDLVHETIRKVRDGIISREEGREEIKATLRRYKYDAAAIKYALTEYKIYS